MSFLEPYFPPKIPELQYAKEYDGGTPANRWLEKLDFDFEMCPEPVPDNKFPEYFFRAIVVLFSGKAAEWIEETPRYSDMVANRKEKGKADVTEFREALAVRFPTKAAYKPVERGHLRIKIRNFRQEPDESLMDCYLRAQHLLREAHGRDRPTAVTESIKALEPLEEVVLVDIMNAYCEGLKDKELRKEVMSKNVSTFRSLAETFQVTESTSFHIASLREAEERMAEQERYEKLKIKESEFNKVLEEKAAVERMREYFENQLGIPIPNV